YCGLSAPKWRTVRSSILRTPPETSSLDKFQVSTADCPFPYSGPSAVSSAKPPETTSSLDEPNLTGGLSAPPKRTVRDTQLLTRATGGSKCGGGYSPAAATHHGREKRPESTR